MYMPLDYSSECASIREQVLGNVVTEVVSPSRCIVAEPLFDLRSDSECRVHSVIHEVLLDHRELFPRNCGAI